MARLFRTIALGALFLFVGAAGIFGESRVLGLAWSDGNRGGEGIRFSKDLMSYGDILSLEIVSGEVRRVNFGALHKNGNWTWFSEKRIYPVKGSGELLEYPIFKTSGFAGKMRSSSYTDFIVAINGKEQFQPVEAEVKVFLRKPLDFSGEQLSKGNIHLTRLGDYYGIPDLKFTVDNYQKYRNQMCRLYLIASKNDRVDQRGLLRDAVTLDFDGYIEGNHRHVMDLKNYETNLNFPDDFDYQNYYFQVYLTDREDRILEISDIRPYGYIP